MVPVLVKYQNRYLNSGFLGTEDRVVNSITFNSHTVHQNTWGAAQNTNPLTYFIDSDSKGLR